MGISEANTASKEFWLGLHGNHKGKDKPAAIETGHGGEGVTKTNGEERRVLKPEQ